jgi:hypothetical protein
MKPHLDLDDCDEPNEQDAAWDREEQEQADAERQRDWREVDLLDRDTVNGALQDESPDNGQDEENEPTPAEICWNYLNGPVSILGITHGKDVHRRKPFEQEDPRDRKAFCAGLRSYHICNHARYLLNTTTEDKMNRLPYPDKLPTGFDKTDPEHRAIGAVMFAMNREGGSINRICGHWNKAQGLIRNFRRTRRKQAQFQIGLRLLGAEYEFLSLRDLRVLIAVNSCMGKHGFAVTHLKTIGWRAVGATNEGDLDFLGVRPLTKRQVQAALKSLTTHGLIQCRRVKAPRCICVATPNMSKKKFYANIEKRMPKRHIPLVKLQDGRVVDEN